MAEVDMTPEEKILEIVGQLFIKCGIKIKNTRLIKEAEKKAKVKLETDDGAIAIGKKGATLDAFQILINTMLKKVGVDYQVIIDINNYREKRIRALKKKAKEAVAKVKAGSPPIYLEPMNAYERSVIYSMYENDKRIKLSSVGEGTYQQIKIEARK